jgi:putative sigma-54 modulation protein
MKTNETALPGAKLVLRGINLKLTAAMEATFTEKLERLFRHEPRIIRVRLDLEDVSVGGTRRFEAKGHIEIAGPDLVASVASDDAYKSVDMLVDRLDRMLRKRMAALTSRRHDGDIRDHTVSLAE